MEAEGDGGLTELQVKLLAVYVENLQETARQMAEHPVLAEAVGIEAVGITILTRDEAIATQVVCPEAWSLGQEAAFMVGGAEQFVERAGGSITFVNGEAPVRPLPRRRRTHRRR